PTSATKTADASEAAAEKFHNQHQNQDSGDSGGGNKNSNLSRASDDHQQNHHHHHHHHQHSNYSHHPHYYQVPDVNFTSRQVSKDKTEPIAHLDPQSIQTEEAELLKKGSSSNLNLH